MANAIKFLINKNIVGVVSFALIISTAGLVFASMESIGAMRVLGIIPAIVFIGFVVRDAYKN